MLWYIRKIGMNLYKDFKKRHNYTDDEIKLEINNNGMIILFSLILFLCIAMGIDIHRKFTKNDILLVSTIAIILLIFYLT